MGTLYLGDNPADQTSGGLPVRRLNDQYTGLNQRGQGGFSFYSGLNVRFQTNNLHNTGLSLVSNYTWSHAIDNTSSTFSEFNSDCCNLGLLNPLIPAEDKGNSAFDIRHRWVLSGTWDTPWYKNDQSWWKKNILGSWTFAPIVTVQSGAPFSLYDCFNTFFNVCPRWDAALDSGSLPYAAHSVGNGCPYPATFLGRNNFAGPGLWNIDMGIYKTFAVTERFKLQFRGELYNMFNHSNLYVQGGSLDVEAGLLPAVAAKGGFHSTASDERRNIQFGLKLIF
jgi:hypothetical protein